MNPIQKTGSSHCRGKNSITISNLTDADYESLEAMTLGSCWVRRGENGRVERRDRYEDLPPCEPDENLIPFWKNTTKGSGGFRSAIRQIEFDGERSLWSPSIFIQHVGAGGGNYKETSNRLDRYGFACMRSRRGPNSRYWEVWYLPGLFFARDELRDAIDAADIKGRKQADRERLKADAARSHLCKTCSFGTLDISIQRAALVYD